MHTDQRVYSLPKKTQPTVNSSARYQRTTDAKQLHRGEVCPEVLEFGIRMSSKELYVHHLNIDYGKLKQPFYDNHCEVDQEYRGKIREIESGFLYEGINTQTQRFIGISAYEQSTVQKQPTSKKVYVSLDVLTTDSADRSVSANVTATKKQKIRIKQVRAYEELTKRSTSRRRLHSRIVRIMVGGGKAETRIINYPDNAQYLKLCALK